MAEAEEKKEVASTAVEDEKDEKKEPMTTAERAPEGHSELLAALLAQAEGGNDDDDGGSEDDGFATLQRFVGMLGLALVPVAAGVGLDVWMKNRGKELGDLPAELQALAGNAPQYLHTIQVGVLDFCAQLQSEGAAGPQGKLVVGAVLLVCGVGALVFGGMNQEELDEAEERNSRRRKAKAKIMAQLEDEGYNVTGGDEFLDGLGRGDREKELGKKYYDAGETTWEEEINRLIPLIMLGSPWIIGLSWAMWSQLRDTGKIKPEIIIGVAMISLGLGWIIL